MRQRWKASGHLRGCLKRATGGWGRRGSSEKIWCWWSSGQGLQPLATTEWKGDGLSEPPTPLLLSRVQPVKNNRDLWSLSDSSGRSPRHRTSPLRSGRSLGTWREETRNYKPVFPAALGTKGSFLRAEEHKGIGHGLKRVVWAGIWWNFMECQFKKQNKKKNWKKGGVII